MLIRGERFSIGIEVVLDHGTSRAQPSLYDGVAIAFSLCLYGAGAKTGAADVERGQDQPLLVAVYDVAPFGSVMLRDCSPASASISGDRSPRFCI